MTTYAPGSTSVSVDVFFADDTGAAVTGKVAADFPACHWSAGNNTADTTITLSDLTLITTAHPNDNTAGGIKEREGGWYRLDLPNNVFTAAGAKRLTFAESAGKRIIAPAIDVQYVQADVEQWKGSTAPSMPANFASLVIDSTGRVNAFLIGILTSVFTEGATGRIAAAFKQFLNVATPTSTMNEITLVDTTTTATNLTTNNDKTGYHLATEVHSGTAITGSSNTIQLDAGAAGVDGFYNDCWIVTTGGSGSPQCRLITAYVGATNTATVSPNWVVDPDLTTTFTILPASTISAVLSATLATSQPDYAPAKAGDQMALTSAYDAAKTAAQAGNAMTLTSAYDAAKTAMQAGATVKLASDGLDAISTTAPTNAGLGSINFRQMLVMTWRRFFKKSAMTSSQLQTFADDGTTVISTQALSDDGTTQTQGSES